MHNCENFSIRRAVAGFRDRDWMRNYPFRIDRELTPEKRMLMLPPLDTPKFQWWYCRNCVKEIIGSTSDRLEMDNVLDGNNGLINLDQGPSAIMNGAASVVPDAEDAQTNMAASGHNVETGLPVAVNRTVMFDLNKPPLPELCEEPALSTLGITDDELPRDNRDCHITECASAEEKHSTNDEVGGTSLIAGVDETTGRNAEAVGAILIAGASISAHDDHPSSERTLTDEFSEGEDYMGMDYWEHVKKRPKRYRLVGDLMKVKGPIPGNIQSGGTLNGSTSDPQEAEHVHPSQDDFPLDSSLRKCQTSKPNKSGNLVVPRKRRIFGNEVSPTGVVTGEVDPVQSDGGPWKRLRKPLDDKAYKQGHNPVVQKEKSPLPHSKESASKKQRSSRSQQRQNKLKRDATAKSSEQRESDEALVELITRDASAAGPSSQLQLHMEESMSGMHLLSLVVAAETGEAVTGMENRGALVPLDGAPEEDLCPLDTVAPLNSGVLALGYSGCTEVRAPHDFLLVADDIEQFQLNPDQIRLRPSKKRPAAREQHKKQK